MPSPDQQIDLTFPISGTDITTEYELQPENTSAQAINVRSLDAHEQRNRGGSRPGLIRYLNDQIGGIHGLVQHINIIVDPTVDATQAQEEDYEFNPGGLLDPTNNPAGRPIRNRGRYIRPKGSGRAQKRGVGTKVLPTAVGESLTASFGDGYTDIDVLANDTYVGTPTITIVSPPLYGTATVVGRGTAARIRYIPPHHELSVDSESFKYRLRATGNAPGSDNVLYGQNFASVTVNFSTDPPDVPTVEGDLTWFDMTPGDGYWLLDITIMKYNGVVISNTRIKFCSDTIYFDEGICVLYQGPYPPTFDDGGPGDPQSGLNGHLNVYGMDGGGNPKATVLLNGHAYGDEV